MVDFFEDHTVLPHRLRSPFVVFDKGHLKAEDGCFLLVRDEESIEVPVAMASVIMLEPGVTVTHEAVKLASRCGTLLLWTGEAGVRVYASGSPGGKSWERLLDQAGLRLDPVARMKAARRLYRLMFDEDMPETRSIDVLRGLEGQRVKSLYAKIAAEHGVLWTGRAKADRALQDALGFATSCLYGLSEAVILAAGYSPAIGVVHSGDVRSMVFDLADTVKFSTVVPAAFKVYSESPIDTGNRVRRRCRDIFRESNLAALLFRNIFEIMGANADRASTG